MNYKEINYSKYLSVDNGKGILLNKQDIDILNKYGFDYNKYTRLSDLIFDIDNYCNEGYAEEDLEEVIQRLSEMHYYNEVNK